MNDQQFTVRADEAITLRIVLARPGVLVARVVPDGASAASRPEVWPVSVGDFQARWVSEPGKPVPGVPRGSGRADAAHGWTCRFEDLRSNAAVRCWAEGAGMFDETFVKIGPGEEKTIELRPRATGAAKLETSRKVIGWVVIEVADDTGGWHHVANKSLARLEAATFEITRPAGAFRWRARLWPIDSPGTNPPKTAEGEAKIEAGKMTAIVVDLPDDGSAERRACPREARTATRAPGEKSEASRARVGVLGPAGGPQPATQVGVGARVRASEHRPARASGRGATSSTPTAKQPVEPSARHGLRSTARCVTMRLGHSTRLRLFLPSAPARPRAAGTRCGRSGSAGREPPRRGAPPSARAAGAAGRASARRPLPAAGPPGFAPWLSRQE